MVDKPIGVSFYVPGTVVKTGVIGVNKTEKRVSPLGSLYSSG